MPKIGPGLSSLLLTMELPAAVFCAHLILPEQVSIVQELGILALLGAIIYLKLVKAKKGNKQQRELQTAKFIRSDETHTH